MVKNRKYFQSHMDIEILRNHVLTLENVTEGFPFGEEVLVFKVNDKIFLLLPLDSSPLQFNVKCDPHDAIELREKYPESVLPGYHMNKKHWNTVIANGIVPGKLLLQMIENSYKLVRKKGTGKK